MYHEIVLIGVAVSLLFTELTGFSPAGLIVPGYIVLCLQTPVRIVYTLVIALLAWGGGKLLGNFMILYGRRRFAVMILLAFTIDLIIASSEILPYDPGIIGVLVPGIIANELERQGAVKSLMSLAVVVGILALIMMGMGISPPMKETSVSSSMDPGQRIRWISGRTRMSMSTIWVSPCQEVRTATLTVLTRGRRMGR